MPPADPIRLRLAIDRLSATATDHYAIWVVEAPYPGGYVHHDRIWTTELGQLCHDWLDFFSLRGLPDVPQVPSAYVPPVVNDPTDNQADLAAPNLNYSSRLMQTFGVRLWQWLFDGDIHNSLAQSIGIAMGQNSPLCLYLDIRSPSLIALPWEIIQRQPGLTALSLHEHIHFSRTTSAVDPLGEMALDSSLKILLVLGEDDSPTKANDWHGPKDTLQLDAEAATLKRILQGEMSSGSRNRGMIAPCQVDVLLKPSPAELIKALERGRYNIFFYAGHGIPAPDGGLLFPQANAPLNGTELAHALTRGQVKLAVFNTCWGAQPDQQNRRTIARSSLAEVLLHHGVPAVLAMRDSIADEEALSFIQVFAQALAQRHPVNQAVAIARKHLLTVYNFNQPAWTLPVLYMHPDYDGQILEEIDTEITRLPGDGASPSPVAAIRVVEDPSIVWYIYGGVMRVGRQPENDLVVPEPWVSSRHAEIFCRQFSGGVSSGTDKSIYYLKDNSRYGTFYQEAGGWRLIHRQEVSLQSGTQLRFGSPQGRLMEFVIEG